MVANSQSMILQWNQSGGPAVVPPKRRGFGSRLIETVFKAELSGSELQFLPEGVICQLDHSVVVAAAAQPLPRHGR
jgi:two-component system, chemotaxis family, CheB/CheR fusion protein